VKITNKHGLPEAFVRLAENEYVPQPGIYRVTELLKGTRETILNRRYHDQVEVDVADMVWLLFGTAVHSMLESQQEAEQEIKESRLSVDFGHAKLTGQFDLYNAAEKKITDYKTASVWKIIYGDYADWKKQLLIYAHLLGDAGFPVYQADVLAFLKNHSKTEARRKADYPQLPVKKVNFQFSAQDHRETVVFIDYKLKELEHFSDKPDAALPLCTPEERFNSGDKFAAMKGNNKRALRVLDSEEEARQWVADNPGKGGDWVEHRPGVDRKCLDYCNVREFCNHYKEEVEPCLSQASS